jgi:hypothetical protein
MTKKRDLAKPIFWAEGIQQWPPLSNPSISCRFNGVQNAGIGWPTSSE